MAIEDQRLPRDLPFCIFQHATTEFLVSFQLYQAKYVLKVPDLQTMIDPLAAISAEEYNIPSLIYDYICGFCPTITPGGDKVFWNLPTCAIQKSITASGTHILRTDTSGPVTAANHNVYECYVSPYSSVIAYRYIHPL